MDDDRKREAQQEEENALYEGRDARFAVVFSAILIIVCSLVLIASGSWWMFIYYKNRAQLLEAPISPLVARTRKPLPPEPRLQVFPEVDLQQMRDWEDSVLNSYAWVEPDKLARVPIARSMEIVLKHGLPTTTTQAVVPTNSLEEPSDTRSGRIVKGDNR